MNSKHTFRIILKQRGAEALDGGLLELERPYGTATTTDAATAALAELHAAGSFVQFRQHVIPADLFGGLHAELVSMERAE